MKNNKGFSMIELMITVVLIVFLLFAVFYAISSVISGSILTEKRVELTNQLDKRVNEFMVTGEFDTSDADGITFAKLDSDDEVAEFSATNEAFSLTIIKRAFEIIDAEDVFTGITDIECAAVSHGHCACTVSNEDRLQRCMELIGTDNQNDPNVAKCQEQHGGSNPNEAGYQCAGACGEGLHPSCVNLLVICHKPGTPAEKTMVLPYPALNGHMNHGDHLGPC
ncbi:type II secretion system protein [Candidatus Francisella endociliophora]|uniref:type II secretion system protein n=1 Tax=Candidatus Francisella endociliophora TaxID=653937 RepID=UPI00069340FA|nr:prepilin-type N-terminal cleavage/methylation domain-containing protein [Francisella sp. FSC1006]